MQEKFVLASQTSVDVSQIAYFCTKCPIFWVHTVCASDAFTQVSQNAGRLFTHSQLSQNCGTMDTWLNACLLVGLICQLICYLANMLLAAAAHFNQALMMWFGSCVTNCCLYCLFSRRWSGAGVRSSTRTEVCDSGRGLLCVANWDITYLRESHSNFFN